MRAFLAAAGLIAAIGLPPAQAVAASCPNEADAMGVARIVEIDVSGGPLYGDITNRRKEANFLRPKEVVLTFDDGPIPSITGPILDTLDRFCTKATFFSVGRMAITYPGVVKDILRRGHTLGAHTWSHPLNIARLRLSKAKDQIERGFAAVALAAGQPIAPFFRFPGLSDSRRLLDYLQNRHIGSFTVDVVSNDSFISSAARLTRLTLERVERNRGGILLFHDIKRSTAKALPAILSGLKERGYKIVHLRAKGKLEPLQHYTNRLAPVLAKVLAKGLARRKTTAGGGDALRTAAITAQLLPFYGTIGPGKYAIMKSLGPPVTRLAPPPRQRITRPRVRKRAGKRDAPRATKPAAPARRLEKTNGINGPLFPAGVEAEPILIRLPEPAYLRPAR